MSCQAISVNFHCTIMSNINKKKVIYSVISRIELQIDSVRKRAGNMARARHEVRAGFAPRTDTESVKRDAPALHRQPLVS